MKKLFWEGFATAFALYVCGFAVWIFLGWACLGNGNSPEACADNTMSRVAVKIYPVHAIADALR